MKLKKLLEDLQNQIQPKLSKTEIYIANKLFDDAFVMFENLENSLKRLRYLAYKRKLQQDSLYLESFNEDLFRLKEELNEIHNDFLKRNGKI